MKSGRLKFLFLFITCFLMLKGLVHSSTGDHSITRRNDGSLKEPNFTTTAESDRTAVSSAQYEEQFANNRPTVSTAPTRENPIVEGPKNSEVEIEGGQNSGPGVATFILFFVIIAWLTTAGGPKEN
jgi:hypothetical protein